jgi:DNA gyrase/topoisomerase IV subunit A
MKDSLVKDQRFEKDNAFLLSKFEEVAGSVDHTKAKNKSLEKQLLGLQFTIENLENELVSQKKNNQILKAEIKQMKDNFENERILIPENFKIRNKIIKIVSDIENKELTSLNLKDLIETLIGEIEFCISHLENK